MSSEAEIQTRAREIGVPVSTVGVCLSGHGKRLLERIAERTGGITKFSDLQERTAALAGKAAPQTSQWLSPTGLRNPQPPLSTAQSHLSAGHSPSVRSKPHTTQVAYTQPLATFTR